MNNINQKKVGVILAYISQIIHMISGLIYTPIMLRILGQSEYGLYQMVNSIVSYLGLLSFGFSSAYMRFYSQYEKENNEEEIKKLNGMFLIIFTIIAAICMLSGIFMTNNITEIFKQGLQADEYMKARILMMLMVIGLSITLFSTPFTCYATANEQFIFQRLLEVLQNLFNPFITLPLLILGYGSVGMVLVSTTLVFIKFIVNMRYCRKKLYFSFRFKNIDVRLLKDMGIFTFFIFLNQIIDKVNWSLDKVLLGRYCDTIAVAIYGVASNLNLMYQNLLTAISSVFIPKINRIVANQNDNIVLTKLFTKVGRIQFMMAYLIVSGYIFFGKIFIYLWAGKGYEESYYVGLLLIIPATMELIQYIGIEIQKAKNMHQARSIVYAIISIGNVIISIPLIIKFGAIGAALGTTVSLFCGTWMFMNYYYHKKIGVDIVFYWKNIFKLIPAIIPSILIGILITKFIHIKTWLSLILFVLLYTMVYSISIILIGLNEEEKNMVEPILKKFQFNKLKNKILNRSIISKN